eukprot:scaffold97747_cov51-Attheya_sp.AAC.2
MGVPKDANPLNSTHFRGTTKGHLFFDIGCEGNKNGARSQTESFFSGLKGQKETGWTDGVLKGNRQLVAFAENHIKSLDKDKELFFDNDDEYKTVLHTKRLVDPCNVFTTNTMTIGFTKKDDCLSYQTFVSDRIECEWWSAYRV